MIRITRTPLSLEQRKQTTKEALADLTDTTQTALCEMDVSAMALAERIDAIEEALCEMDAANE